MGKKREKRGAVPDSHEGKREGTESEGLREERNQGNDLDGDSAVKQRTNLTERAGELTREREVVRGYDTERERDGSHEREREKLEGIPSQIHLLYFPPAPLRCSVNG